MGVPSFFKWLQAKYPLILRQILEGEGASQTTARVAPDNVGGGGGGSGGPESVTVHNLYLDTNGIIHPACHPEDGPQPKDEGEMFANVEALIDRLVRAVRPQQLLYIALDGCAPRAKMNQQRARRFCSAREAAEADAAKQELMARHVPGADTSHFAAAGAADGAGAEPKAGRWDHNVITPGTAFMARLATFLRDYVARRQHSGGPTWRNLLVVVDDAACPGEGEHKVVDYIRRLRRSPAHDPETCHAICGQDANLIMLGLSLHEPRVLILRERVLGVISILGLPGFCGFRFGICASKAPH